MLWNQHLKFTAQMETAFKDCDHYLCLLVIHLLPTFV